MKSAYEAYGISHKNSLKGRTLEAESFMKAVTLLKRAEDFPQNKRLLAQALEYTRKLWTIVQADLKSPDNQLDDKLKAKLLSLSLYVDKTCLEVIKKPHPHALQGLIDVNQNVARGLFSTG
ncbi:Flagellar FlaF family protein [Candidatus Terasakiella magnetica]|uniref:Flagellar FlaF family protein n=1 Tax=Candidatus Terasakiella magnetica TaxID=1867952 RepID=A0A1C3RFI1_9PROT|nr:flagellar biosynthesis regulator FlaF [Candidatus Terasakiella magnetica]SCA56056.1 Flagellar FlaF family protein [Candidatus Terasakiella magnetica]